jgi:hypothetical protein
MTTIDMPKKTKLTFGPNVKTHDGLRPESRLLESLVHAYFNDQVLLNEDALRLFLYQALRRYKLPNAKEALSQLVDKLGTLIEKTSMLQHEYKTIPALTHGGGKGHQLDMRHITHLKRLCKWVETIVS